MKRRPYGIAVLVVSVLLGASARAQSPAGEGQPAPMTNLQVFAKETPWAQVMQTMTAFNESLGVGCAYCHVQDAAGRIDYASDDKREKKVARQMILLRDSINVMMPAMVGKPAGAGPTSGSGRPGAPVRVLCRSCHRGLPIPVAITDVVAEAAASGGAAAGLAKYAQLRAQYYGGQEYDFTENSLLTVAQRAMAAKNPDAAIVYLQANLEHYPKSARTYHAMAQAKRAKGDTAGAIADLERALAFDPKNAQAGSELQQLKAR